MNRFRFTQGFTAFLIIALCGLTFGQDTSRELQQSVGRLKVWLGQNDQAVEWRKALQINVLETQSAKGSRADLAKLERLFGLFNQDDDSLKHPAFNDVRLALARQIRRLSQMKQGDYLAQVADAKSGFQQSSVEQMDFRRDQAVYHWKVLKKYYKHTLPSRKRALLYYDLQIDDMISFMEDLEMEIPPFVSIGKLRDEISGLKEQQEEVIEKLDALPVLDDPSSEDEDENPVPDNTDPPIPDDDDSGPNASAQEVDLNAPQQDEDDVDEYQVRRDRELLTERKDQIASKIKVVEEMMEEVAQKDEARLEKRKKSLAELGKFNRLIVEAAKTEHNAYFASAQAAFGQLAMSYFYGTDDNLQALYDEQLESLSEAVQKLGTEEHRLATARIGSILGWLENAEQAPHLVTSFRRNLSQPNMYFSLSRNLVNRLASQPIADGRRVNEMLLGRLVRGEATTRGNINIDFIENQDEAQFSVHLLGGIDSNTYTQTGRITAYTSSQGQIEARRNVFVNIGGLIAGDSYGAANMDSQLDGISSRLRIIQRLASKEFAKSELRGEGISARRVEERMMSQFDEQTDEVIGKGQDRLAELSGDSRDFYRFLPQVHLQTSSERLYAVGEKSSLSTLAAHDFPVAGAINPDITLTIHETLLSNYVDPIFNGKRFSNERLAERATELTGREMVGLKGDENDADWTITFSGDRPIQFEFENNRLGVSITGVQFKQGRNTIRTGLKIRLQFKIVNRNNALVLVRDGDASIDYLDPDKKDARVVAFKTFLEKKLNSGSEKKEDDEEQSEVVEVDREKETDAEADPKEIKVLLPENLLPVDLVPALADSELAKDLKLVQVRMEGGWLYLGWNHSPNSNGSFGGAMDTPAIFYEQTISAPEMYLQSDPELQAPIEMQAPMYGNQSVIDQTIQQGQPVYGEFQNEVQLFSPAMQPELTPIPAPINDNAILDGSVVPENGVPMIAPGVEPVGG